MWLSGAYMSARHLPPWGPKLSVHIFICWKGSLVTSFSALLVADYLAHSACYFVCCTETHTIKHRGSLPEATSFSDGAWLSEEQEQGSPVAMVPSEHCAHGGNIPTSLHVGIAHLCIWVLFVCLLPKCSSTTFIAVVWNPERWTLCEIRNFLCFLEPKQVCVLHPQKRKIHLLLAPYLLRDCYPHLTVKLYFQFLAEKGNVWPSLRIYQAWNQLGVIMTSFGIRSGPKPQWNQYVISFPLPWKKHRIRRIVVAFLPWYAHQLYSPLPLKYFAPRTPADLWVWNFSLVGYHKGALWSNMGESEDQIQP